MGRKAITFKTFHRRNVSIIERYVYSNHPHSTHHYHPHDYHHTSPHHCPDTMQPHRHMSHSTHLHTTQLYHRTTPHRMSPPCCHQHITNCHILLPRVTITNSHHHCLCLSLPLVSPSSVSPLFTYLISMHPSHLSSIITSF